MYTYTCLPDTMVHELKWDRYRKGSLFSVTGLHNLYYTIVLKSAVCLHTSVFSSAIHENSSSKASEVYQFA